jgi:hypothetical protein
VPLAIWPCAWIEAAVPATSIKPRSIFPAAAAMPGDRIKLNCGVFFIVVSFMLLRLI